MRCGYWERHECRSCGLIETPRVRQLEDKELRARAAVGENAIWSPAFAGAEAAYRNKAKMVVGGTWDAPTLGILDAEQRGVDLSACGILNPALTAALPAFSRFIALARLVPYAVRERRGELKHVIVTTSPAGELMARFVLRSTESLPRIRKHLPTLLGELPGLRVVTANLLPAHAALLEGDEEIALTAQQELVMPVDGLALRIPPRAFFQTNTVVAAALYAQARDWAVEALRLAPLAQGTTGALVQEATGALAQGTTVPLPERGAAESKGRLREIWDLYCGVGGFALSLAGPGRRVIGVESSADAIAAARRTAVGRPDTAFVAADATQWARQQPVAPDLVVVNPPRRGLGPDLSDWLEASGVGTVIYSSCNPDTLASDLARMPSLRPIRARAFDMFPQTEHLEVMVLLGR